MKRYSSAQYIMLALIGIGIPLFVIFRNIFPHFTFSLNQSLEFGLGFTAKQLAGQDYLIVALGTQYPFDTTSLSFNLDKETAGRSETVQVAVAKDYLVNTYPTGPAVEDKELLRKYLFEGNPEGVANGSQYSYGESVFIVSRGQYYPIIAPVVFESLGYHWEQVLPLEADAYAQLKSAEKVNYMSVHPDGTLLRTKAGSFFVVWEGKRLPIKDSAMIEQVWKTYYWVDIESENLRYFATCQAKVHSNGRASCEMHYGDEERKGITTLGNVYIVTLDPTLVHRLLGGKTTFETSLNMDNSYLKFSLGQIKNKLYMRYAGYFL